MVTGQRLAPIDFMQRGLETPATLLHSERAAYFGGLQRTLSDLRVDTWNGRSWLPLCFHELCMWLVKRMNVHRPEISSSDG